MNAYAGNPEMQEQITMAVEKALPQPKLEWWELLINKVFDVSTSPIVQVVFLLVAGAIAYKLIELLIKSKYTNFITDRFKRKAKK